MSFLCAVPLYCVLAISPSSAFSWKFIPWIFVMFGTLSVIFSEQPSQSSFAAQQIAITVLAAIMFAQGLQARSLIAVAKGLME